MGGVKRKTDRRTIYTCSVIKEAVLDLLSEKDFYQITVTDICKQAEISRGTFYLHFDNISQIVDELIDDVLQQSTPLSAKLAFQAPDESKCVFPLCQLLRANRRYQPLFLSDSLRSRVLHRLTQRSGSRFADEMPEHESFSEKELQALRIFQMSGCLAVCRQNMQLSDEEWAVIQCSVGRLLQAGFRNYSATPSPSEQALI